MSLLLQTAKSTALPSTALVESLLDVGRAQDEPELSEDDFRLAPAPIYQKWRSQHSAPSSHPAPSFSDRSQGISLSFYLLLIAASPYRPRNAMPSPTPPTSTVPESDLLHFDRLGNLHNVVLEYDETVSSDGKKEYILPTVTNLNNDAAFTPKRKVEGMHAIMLAEKAGDQLRRYGFTLYHSRPPLSRAELILMRAPIGRVDAEVRAALEHRLVKAFEL